MRERILKAFSDPAMLALVLMAWIVVRADAAVWDSDFWFHIRNVEYLFAHGHTPGVDLYSYTTNQHPYLVHQWLAEIPYYAAWHAGGLMGVYLLFTSLLMVIHLGIWAWAYFRSRNLKASFLVAFLAPFLTSISFGPRTLLFSYTFLLALLFILARYRETGKSALWAVPPLFCLWINFHGTWPLGMVILGIYIISGLKDFSCGQVDSIRWTPQQLRSLLVTAGVSVAALLVNPFGHRLVFYPFEMAFRQKLNVGFTDEWASVDFNEPLGKAAFVMLAGVLLAFLLSRHRWKLEEVLMAGLAIYSGLMHIRFLFLAAILLAPLVARMLDGIQFAPGLATRRWLSALAMGFALFAAAYHFPSRDSLRAKIEKRYPVQGVRYMQANGLAGNIFNRYMWGGYLVGCCPEMKTFIDTRADIFEYTGVFKDYLDIEGLRGSLGILDKYQVRYALISPDSKLAYLLKNNAGWKVRYTDEVAIILERVPVQPAASDQTSSRGAN